jgi:hypothetical protein
VTVVFSEFGTDFVPHVCEKIALILDGWVDFLFRVGLANQTVLCFYRFVFANFLYYLAVDLYIEVLVTGCRTAPCVFVDTELR